MQRHDGQEDCTGQPGKHQPAGVCHLMRKIIIGLVVLLVLGLALAVAAAAWTVHEFADPESRASLAFKDRFEAECVAAAGQPAGGNLTPTQMADLSAICTCGADQMRDDIAATGLAGLAHLLAVEGIDAKIQRVLDSCQTTPSEP